MSRTTRDSVIGGVRNIPLGHRRGLSINGAPNNRDPVDDKLDLFSRNRRSLPVASSEDSDVSMKLGRLSLGSVKQPKNGSDDLLSSEGGKHDYDWLLTPPGTPLVSSSNRNESQTALVPARGGPVVRSISAAKTSRLSVSSENNHTVKPARSSSVTRPAPSASQYGTYSNKSAAILNTSSSSVSSYIRPATPTSRSSSISRPTTPSARPSVSRSSTPSKLRPVASPSSLVVDKPRPSVNSRPSTPTSRSQVSTSLNGPPSRIASRPSTPTRRNSTSSSSVPSTPGGRSLSNGRSVSSVSRPSSPGPRVRPPPQSIVLADFPLETPPNLRTTLPDRPLSAGRSRPGVAVTAKRNEDHVSNTIIVPKRQPSPVANRGRSAEPPAVRNRALANGHVSDGVESRRELPSRRPVSKTSTESTGFGRTISKKSLDVAIRHMDIRNGDNGVRAVTGTNVFPRSIRCSKNRQTAAAASMSSSTGTDNEEDKKSQCSSRVTNPDVYESCQYDMLLLKEDLNNTNWLHSIDDKPDQELLMFDNGFGVVPEPFSPLS